MHARRPSQCRRALPFRFGPRTAVPPPPAPAPPPHAGRQANRPHPGQGTPTGPQPPPAAVFMQSDALVRVNMSVLLAASAVVAAVVAPVALADILAGPPDDGRDAPAPDTARQRSAVTGPDASPYTYLKCRSASDGGRLARDVLGYADGDLVKAAEMADLWVSMVPDFPPDSDCHWKCIVHGLNRTSCDPVYAPIVLPCGPESEDHTCQSFVCRPVWDGDRMHCGYHGNVTGHTHVITDGAWARGDP